MEVKVKCAVASEIAPREKEAEWKTRQFPLKSGTTPAKLTYTQSAVYLRKDLFAKFVWFLLGAAASVRVANQSEILANQSGRLRMSKFDCHHIETWSHCEKCNSGKTFVSCDGGQKKA
jgi:hypothetical protein